MSNRFSRLIAKVNYAPKSWRPFLLTKLFCSQVKFAGTAGIEIRDISHQRVEIKLANRKKVQNHIGGVHAIAAALIAESATGIVFGMNLPDEKLPLLKSMTIDYQRRMQGGLTAIATLTDQQMHRLNHDEKGDMEVSVAISDESNEQPVVCQMTWAWVNKKR